MTVWRGMFRMWILATFLWSLFVLLLGWSQLASPILPQRSYYLQNAQAAPYQLAEAHPGYEWVRQQREFYLPNSITLYAARDIPEAALEAARRNVTRQASDPRNGEAWVAPFKSVGWMLALILGVSLVVLAFGFAVRWVVQGFGFAAKKPTS